MKKVVYSLTSEGKVIYGDSINDELHCGEFYINEVELEFDVDDLEGDEMFIDGSFNDSIDVEEELIEGFVDSVIIEDKWGSSSDVMPKEITNVWENDLEVEFTNGTIHWGYFESLEVAQKEMNKHFKGSVDVLDLAK